MSLEDRAQTEALERFSNRIKNAWRWPQHCVLTFPDRGYDPVEVFREVHAALACAESVLPAFPIEMPDSAHDGKARVSSCAPSRAKRWNAPPASSPNVSRRVALRCRGASRAERRRGARETHGAATQARPGSSFCRMGTCGVGAWEETSMVA
jgi:hypothetical protein